MIAIVEDEPLWREQTGKIISRYLKNETIDEYESGRSFLQAAKKYDIVLYDVELNNDENGLDICAEYKRKYPDNYSIILTTHTEYISRGYIVNAFRYINKENIDEEIKEALETIIKLRRRDETISIHIISASNKDIKVGHIKYIESFAHNVVIHTDKHKLKSDATISSLYCQLDKYGFIKSHKSYIINPEYVIKYDNRSVDIGEPLPLPVSRRYYSEFNRRYVDWKINNINM